MSVRDFIEDQIIINNHTKITSITAFLPQKYDRLGQICDLKKTLRN